MISKELLSEVLKREVTNFEHWDNNEYRCTAYFDGFRQRFFINIYELAHKCKEWANKQGYSMSVHQSEFSGYVVELNYGFSIVDFHNKLEVEAIIKASEWILKELKK